MLRPIENRLSTNKQDKNSDTEQKVEVPSWRFGPAQYWYDLMGIDETGENFSYGFKLKVSFVIILYMYHYFCYTDIL